MARYEPEQGEFGPSQRLRPEDDTRKSGHRNYFHQRVQGGDRALCNKFSDERDRLGESTAPCSPQLSDNCISARVCCLASTRSTLGSREHRPVPHLVPP